MINKIVAKAVVFDDQGRVLLLRRSPTDKQRPGEQDYPGGGIEPGEDLAAGVAREIFEEAGLSVEAHNLQLFYAATEAYKGRSVTRLVFWARIKNPSVRLSFEHDAYRWVEPEQASKEFPHPVYGAALDYGRKHKLFG